MRDVFVVAVGTSAFGRYPEEGTKGLAAIALRAVLEDSRLRPHQIDGVWFSNSTWGSSAGQHGIRGQVALIPHGFAGIPLTNVENGCAGGATALHNAYIGVASGVYDVALAIGAEQLALPRDADPEARKKAFEMFLAGTDVETAPQVLEQLRAAATATQHGQSPGSGADAPRSPFMDIYSSLAREHMSAHGTTPTQLATIASKNHLHGSLNPQAQYRKRMSVDEVLSDRVVSWPLTRSMCSPIGDGAAGVVIAAGEVLPRFPECVPVRVRASVLTAGGERGESERAAQRAYEVAGVGPDDIDVAEVHDATAFGELSLTEALGFCQLGEGGPYAESGATTLGGAKPVNPSGGLECRGHPIGATGLAQIAEIVLQLRSATGERQVSGARMGLAHNAGGFIGGGEAAACVHIFESTRRR